MLEEPPRRQSLASSRPAHLLVLSAKTTTALQKTTSLVAEHLKLYPHLNMADVAYTSQVGRKAFRHRRILVCHSTEDAGKALESFDVTRVLSARRGLRNKQLIFLFSGQGAQYVHMARGLYRSESFFRNQVDECATLLKPSLGLDLCEVIYPPGKRSPETAGRLTQTALTQPA